MNKRIIGLLVIPAIVAGGISIAAVTSNQVHADSKQNVGSNKEVDTPEPGDTPDSQEKKPATQADTETND